MLLSQREFSDRFQSNRLMISLIGMSRIGKSYWADRLTQLGFRHACCDDLIVEKMSDSLVSRDLYGLASWMRQPYSDGYKDRESKYLSFEQNVVEQILAGTEKNLILDSTGSVVYLPSQTQDLLKKRTLVVYLEADEKKYEQIFQDYLTDPRPIVWDNLFERREGESSREALKRCYPKLLKFRAKKYKKLADLTFSFEFARDKATTAQDFFQAIKAGLKA